MKAVFEKFFLLLCAACLLLSLTGCERADYVKAVEVYNSGDFAQAQQMFLALEDYENSAELAKRCQYHLAVAIYSKGDFQNAIPALEALGDYEDCPQLITHSKYQIALQLKESKSYDEAEAAFEALEGYENSADHISDIRWARLFDTLLAKAELQEDGTYRYSTEDSAACILADPQEPQAIRFYTEYSQLDGFSLFDSLTITCRYLDPSVEYAAVSKFILNWHDKQYGSTQTCSGKVASSELSLQTVLAVENYNRETLDIKDKTHTHTDNSDNSMEEGMAANLQTLLPQIPVLLQSLDSRFTPELLGLTQLS